MSNNTERRLEIIEARRRNILAEWDPLPARRYNVTVIVDEDVEWLIARVKELEAQAARWYPVLMAWRAQNDTWAEYEMLAAKEDVDDERMYVMRRAWTIGDRVLEELGKACRAALAALEAE